MPFIALCPHCRQAKVQAPKRKRGLMHSCPKCSGTFALEPWDESALPVDYRLPPEDFDLSKAYEEKAEDFATARTIVMKPLEAPTSPPPSEPMQVNELPAATEQTEYPAAPRLPEPPLLLAMAAGSLFGLAMLITLFPIQYERLIALPLLILGLLLGVAALLSIESGRKKIGFAAIAVNALGLLLVLFLPDWLRLGSWWPEADPNAGAKPVMSVPRDGTPPVPADCVDARAAIWQHDDVRVELLSARIEPEDPKAKVAAAQNQVLRISIKVLNHGVARPVPVSGWKPEAQPTLSVRGGPSIVFRKVEATLPVQLNAGKDVVMTLVFAPPPPISDALMLELPGAGIGTTEKVKLRIPAEMIPKPEKPR